MELQDKIKKEISDNSVMLYMKGTKEMPMCGFSSTIVKILDHYKRLINGPFSTNGEIVH